MVPGLTSRKSSILCRLAIIVAGSLSRVMHTGFLIFDKYLGDALYAAMVYAILRICWSKAGVAVPVMLVMTVFELFQLTMIPAKLLTSEHFLVRMATRLMGTELASAASTSRIRRTTHSAKLEIFPDAFACCL